jgi:glycosyltransferase involved in cell wall biosynthesis
MITKVDLVMWTFNGAATLPLVLKRINQVIPEKFINKKIISDDTSTDNTREIAESFGWQVILNDGKGISDNANNALRHVEAEFYISFEQDLVLSPDWWDKITKAFDNPKVAAASGMRFADKPRGIRRMQQYVAKKYKGDAQLASWLKGREMAAFTLGKTLDNTMYRTSIMKTIGYHKFSSSSGVDTLLAYEISQHGYQWLVDYTVQSLHLRSGLMQELKHQYWYAKQLPEMWQAITAITKTQPPPVTKFGVIYRFLISPFTGIFMAYKTGEPSLVYIHPLIRLYYLRGYLNSH